MWKAPLALLAEHETTHPPPTPPGGWVAAVVRAVPPLEADMTAKGITAPTLLALPAPVAGMGIQSENV